MSRPFFRISSYHSYLSPVLAEKLLRTADPHPAHPELLQIGASGGLETPDALNFLIQLYEALEVDLNKVLTQRIRDRKFIDERVKACFQFNQNLGRDWLDSDYQTILGLQDSQGRIVMGPKNQDFCRAGGKPIAPLPPYLQGPHVTLFGPPDSAKLAINAMNAYHRKLPGEPAVVEKLLGRVSPMWGADDEDSKTPLRQDLIEAAENLTQCFSGRLQWQEADKKYNLAKDHLSLPLKRFPGLALPCSFLFLRRSPLPLHLYDFALHVFHHWDNPQALVFYVPKLENEEEAAYIHKMVRWTEERLQALHPAYVLGTIRLMIVLENPRAILRTHEIIDALHPYFAGASLGWHDYLASTARLLKEDANYRIPVKADPGIVYKYIRASHQLVNDVVGSRGGIKVGGMYGILPLAGHPESLQVTLRGFIQDVVSQMKRGLNGFWVAHPDFVRIGLALVEAWRLRTQGDPQSLTELVQGLLNEKYQKEVLAFIEAPDIEGLNLQDPGYTRSLLVADIKESDFIANNHPDEIRYNVFQTLQYLTDWLCGNGCVALPTIVDGIPVRVMDDLATAERSRWEVWAEIHHGRFPIEDLVRIAHEEMNFIRRDQSNDQKIVQVKWEERTEKWYPIAFQIMLKLMTDPRPPEFATELLLPFTIESIRKAQNPWQAALELDRQQFAIETFVARLDHYYEICGCQSFAKTMAGLVVEDLALAKSVMMNFSLAEVNEAAAFHGNIGDSKKVLDARASGEQALVLQDQEPVKAELRALGNEYFKKFGMKFLISAQGKTAAEIKAEILRRQGLSFEEELLNARKALWEISEKRLQRSPDDSLSKIESLRQKHQIPGLSLAISQRGQIQSLNFGESKLKSEKVQVDTKFEIASLSKSIGTAFALDYFQDQKIDLATSVNSLFAKTKSKFRLSSSQNSGWGDQVTLEHLLNHTALNMHYVKGFSGPVPAVSELLEGKHGYVAVDVINEPGKAFHYSGAGFLVLQHLLETMENQKFEQLIQPFLQELGLGELSFDIKTSKIAKGYLDSNHEVPGGHLNFPAIAAGGFGTSQAMALFLHKWEHAFHHKDQKAPLSHDTAVQMSLAKDFGARAFMGCDIGLGVFIAESGENRLLIHQGANEGFRALFLHCYQGPDQGKGFVIFCNGDNRGVPLIAQTAQILLAALGIQGVDHAKMKTQFDFSGLAQEQIVNLGYKTLLFNAFLPDLPEAIVDHGAKDLLADHNRAVGAEILSVTNQRFARAENLLSPYEPVFDPDLYGRQGKIMDSWESVRHNPLGVDTLHVKLKKASSIEFVSLSTKFHDGNHAEKVRILGLTTNGKQIEILPTTKMQGHSLLRLRIPKTEVCDQIWVEMYPDGGLSRLGLFEHLPAELAKGFTTDLIYRRFPGEIPKPHKPLTIAYAPTLEEIAGNQKRAKKIDWANTAFGGTVVTASNEHYGPASQVISAYPAIHMFDGLESARSRLQDHHEEVKIRLGKTIAIKSIELDFKFFVNNNPLFVSVHGLRNGAWIELVGKTKVKAFAANTKVFQTQDSNQYEQICVKTFPDGGIGRIRVFGS